MPLSAPHPLLPQRTFPPFDLSRLLTTVFDPKTGEKLCILIDLDHPEEVCDFAFLKNPQLPIQKKAYDIFYQGLRRGVMQQLQLGACDFFAYKATGGSNLELPPSVLSPEGKVLSFEADLYPHYQIILCISTYSATAPLTAAAKKFGFRGATMHGLNDVIVQSGLAVDYRDVSQETEKLRKSMTQADRMEIALRWNHHDYSLSIELGRQEAQKSHGLCRTAPDIANLPAGEVYFVPTDASGQFPMKLEEDGSIALMEVSKGRIQRVTLLKGSPQTVEKYQKKFTNDPATAVLGELGFGTQPLPYAKADIQDEKALGTFHLATGRNDHLNGEIGLRRFLNKNNATHEDILFSPYKTPEIHIKHVRMLRNGHLETLIENDYPTAYLLNTGLNQTKLSD